MSKLRIFATLVGRYMGGGIRAGTVTGAAYGVAFGLLWEHGLKEFNLLAVTVWGVILGGIYGAILGLLTGFISGLVNGALTALFLYPVADINRYRRMMSALSMLIATGGTLLILRALLPSWTASFPAFLDVVPALLAGASARWVSRRIYGGKAAPSFMADSPANPSKPPELQIAEDLRALREYRAV